jgi:hypothetical protein
MSAYAVVSSLRRCELVRSFVFIGIEHRQRNLHISDRSNCVFALWTPKPVRQRTQECTLVRTAGDFFANANFASGAFGEQGPAGLLEVTARVDSGLAWTGACGVQAGLELAGARAGLRLDTAGAGPAPSESESKRAIFFRPGAFCRLV